MKKNLSKIIFSLLIAIFIVCCCIHSPVSQAVGSLWSLLPPVIAIGLALITKEVYSSLFIGIVTGGIIYSLSSSSGFDGVFTAIIHDGFIANISDSYNVGILIFLVVLGIIVVLMNKAGGSHAYGEWASKHIKNRPGACISTFILGALIFVDDYFNCLTVGSVMRPITDKHNISRSKLAYLIDSTAAPVCIIAPISSWAAAVSGTVEGVNGIQLFISTIPYNLYALLTLLMVIFISVSSFDFGIMKKHELNALDGDLFTTRNKIYSDTEKSINNPKGKVIDLILPVIILIILCVIGMIYTGGFFDGKDFINAFADCDASYGLSLGSVGALLIIIAYFICRRVLSFTECMDSISEGFKQMVPAILILTFAWTLKTMTNFLDAGTFVAGLVENATTVQIFLPAILFIVAMGLSFATGTSWGTFGILIPIVTSVFSNDLANASQTGDIPSLVIICISACLAGAVCGDHCSPISDTTIMASTGAQCDHVNHVSTQLPYALTVAGVSIIGYIISGFVQNVFIVLGCSVLIMIATLFILKMILGKKQNSSKA
ncbi:MAG: Na+/H+ antiporter NhaC family protein [Ruminococcus sp.]|nr:Na+/H+ antiporter NhaC family protein [Ruminococcus sp.]MBP1565322.1 Na+/H+ antiporter NhaC family protein [Oscillospiraceae bacterium]